MKIKLIIYLSPKTGTAFGLVRDSLRAVLPELEVLPGGTISPDKSSFDTYRKQYDAPYLLAQIPPNANDRLCVWILSEDVCAPGKLFIFGAAGERKAIVTSFLLNSKEALGNVTVHEVCHMLGLSHCSGSCIMAPVRSSEESEKRPLRLCTACRNEIAKRDTEKGVNEYRDVPPRTTPLPAVISMSDHH